MEREPCRRPPPRVVALSPADEWSTGRHGRPQMLYGCMLCRATVKRLAGVLPCNGKGDPGVLRDTGPPPSLVLTPTSSGFLPVHGCERENAAPAAGRIAR